MTTSSDEERQPARPDAEKANRFAGVRPKDAASILLIDRSGGTTRVLVGRRGSAHVFMPDVYVFPGGRRDAGDRTLPFAGDLDPLVFDKLMIGPPSRMKASRARALALAALRELTEETGLMPASADRLPDLSCLRFVVRAITPPGSVRRYDTRFFAAFTDEIQLDLTSLKDSVELQDLRWLDIDTLSSLKLPRITERVLEDVKNLLAADPSLPPGGPVSFYAMRRGQFVRSSL